MQSSLKTPVLFIIFNRPHETERVFDVIREIRPERLFIAADGPRMHKASEKNLCDEARRIVENIDWPCSIEKLYQHENLGCKLGVSTAINWFFEHVSEGIILEDDCLPNTSFFFFCEKMLEQYRHEEQVMAINGTCMLTPDELGENSLTYHFSRCLHVWGWATWRRSWKIYDLEMKDLNIFNRLPPASSLFSQKKYLNFWISHFKHIRDKKIDTWDAQWHYSILRHNGVIISPHINMIENIGFGINATHTFTKNPHIIPCKEMNNDIISPENIVVDTQLDSILMDKIYIRSIRQKILSRIGG